MALARSRKQRQHQALSYQEAQMWRNSKPGAAAQFQQSSQTHTCMHTQPHRSCAYTHTQHTACMCRHTHAESTSAFNILVQAYTQPHIHAHACGYTHAHTLTYTLTSTAALLGTTALRASQEKNVFPGLASKRRNPLVGNDRPLGNPTP